MTVPANSFRKVLHSAYTLVRSVEVNKAVSQITLDHLLQEQITFLKKGVTRPLLDGKGESITGVSRLSRWDRLEQLKLSVSNVVEEINKVADDEDQLNALGLFVREKT